MNTHSVSSLSHKAKVLTIFLSVSFLLAILLAKSEPFWSFLSWLPRSIVEGVIGTLHSLFAVFRPLEVHAQEEQLEFLVAWLFSGLVLFIAYMLFIAVKTVTHARSKNAP